METEPEYLPDANVETLEGIRDDLNARPQDRINAANALVTMKAKGRTDPFVRYVLQPCPHCGWDPKDPDAALTGETTP